MKSLSDQMSLLLSNLFVSLACIKKCPSMHEHVPPIVVVAKKGEATLGERCKMPLFI
jgi:hypothetical protein